jgi:hypothetical protein
VRLGVKVDEGKGVMLLVRVIVGVGVRKGVKVTDGVQVMVIVGVMLAVWLT